MKTHSTSKKSSQFIRAIVSLIFYAVCILALAGFFAGFVFFSFLWCVFEGLVLGLLIIMLSLEEHFSSRDDKPFDFRKTLKEAALFSGGFMVILPLFALIGHFFFTQFGEFFRHVAGQ